MLHFSTNLPVPGTYNSENPQNMSGTWHIGPGMSQASKFKLVMSSHFWHVPHTLKIFENILFFSPKRGFTNFWCVCVHVCFFAWRQLEVAFFSQNIHFPSLSFMFTKTKVTEKVRKTTHKSPTLHSFHLPHTTLSFEHQHVYPQSHKYQHLYKNQKECYWYLVYIILNSIR